MVAKTTRELERVRYWQGQLLASGDLRTQLKTDEELARLHNRAVHDAYGIAIGLTPNVKDGVFTLGCGMAYDCAGRALIVEKDRDIPLPSKVTAPMLLVLAYDPNSPYGIALNWKPARDLNANTGVALASTLANKPEIDPDFRPVVARPMARPRLATGNTISGETAWKPWKIGGTEYGVQVVVDTSSAGFTRLPHYFAEAVAGQPETDFVPAWFAHIIDPSPRGFTFQLLLRGIARELLDIVDPMGQVSEPQTPEGVVKLNTGGLFVKGDHVARLLPIATEACTIKTLSQETGNVTLDVGLAEFDAKKAVAFGNAPRVATVTRASTPPTIEVTVDKPNEFTEGDVVVKLGDHPESARPAKIAFIDNEAGILEIPTEIAGLKSGDKLGVAKQASTVLTVAALEITVADPSKYAKGDVLVRLSEPVQTSTPAKIVSKKDDGTLVLSAAITNLQAGSPLGIASEASKVLGVISNAGQVRIQLNNTKMFREQELVAKIGAGGSFTSPVRIERRTPKTLTLSGPIATLAKDDTIGAADFRVRATVLKVAGTIVTVATAPPFPDDEVMFPKGAVVARINDLLSASVPVVVKESVGATLTLSAEIPDLKPGEVIGLCAFPASVQVQSVLLDGRIVVSDAGVLRRSDVVTAGPTRTGIAMVGEAPSGNVVRLVGTIPGLDVGDTLSVTTIRGVMDVTSTGVETKVIVDQPARLRAGDFLADITGWQQVMPDAFATPFVTTPSGNQIALTTPLDGLLQNDTLGLASLTPRAFQIRLEKMSVLVPGDEALIVSLDRPQGNTRSMFASVTKVSVLEKLVELTPVGAQADFRFRPSDVSASVVFVRGSALSLIQKQDLFVSWLAAGEPDTMPRLCAGKAPPDCACTQTKE